MPVVYAPIPEDFDRKINEYIHILFYKKMDSKVYLTQEGAKLWCESLNLWKSVGPGACKIVK
jgi:hypothetical protein